MTTFTDEEARQQFDSILRAARSQGEVRIRAKDGSEFTVKPVTSGQSSFNVPGVDTHLTAEEIVRFVREGREPRP
jgi:hypothetical protein